MTEEPPAQPPRDWLATALAHQKEVSALVTTLTEAITGALVKMKETQNRHERRLAYLVASLLALIIVAGTALVLWGRLDPAAFGFLVGPIVGGLITYLIESLAPVPSFLDIG